MRLIYLVLFLLTSSVSYSQGENNYESWGGKSKSNQSISFSCDLLSDCSSELQSIINSDYINELVEHPEEIDGSITNEIQSLSLSGCNLSISGVPGSINICSILQTLEEERCVGPFHRATRDGWALGTWTPIVTANQGFQTLDWDNIGASRTSPNCTTDMIVGVDFGNFYIQSRRIRANIYIDSRILINGVPVLTFNAVKRIHEDETQDLNPDNITPIQYQTKHPGSYYYERLNVPPSSTVQQQIRVRYLWNLAQTSAYGRIAPALYPSVNYQWEPRNELTDVSLSSQDVYFINELFAGSLEYGFGSPPEGSKVYTTKTDYEKYLKIAESEAEKELINFGLDEKK